MNQMEQSQKVLDDSDGGSVENLSNMKIALLLHVALI